ncbi:hypothetical protein FH972_022321 [Carpinus fangiana]|uniref:Elongator complex protein 4 n=1 Tax=Carpinus fangiana TaxID=176857 RepID=A0A5N6KSH0_9ROSI|nr:hypothetical protein FH972_022321 [Carpinus fangiana]
MAFRKRNVGISKTIGDASVQSAQRKTLDIAPKGSRPSPVDGRLTTSTGTPSLDGLLAGHVGLALGTSVLIEESGTADSAGALLRYYAAEGIVQGHRVHVIGVAEHWARDLPGVVGAAVENEEEAAEKKREHERMKIAWRYEKLGQFEGQARSHVERSPATAAVGDSIKEAEPFCHIFDLTKRLDVPTASSSLQFLQPSTDPFSSPFDAILQTLSKELAASNQSTLHRLVIPSILSPASYPPHAAEPRHLLQFFHAVRGLLRQYPAKLTVLVTLPLELYPRSSSLIRWAELLSDGVLELTPFPHQTDDGLGQTGAATAYEERPQGMFKIHKLPIFHERGGGGGGLKGLVDDFAYTISRRRFAIKPFSLPPAEGDKDAQQGCKWSGTSCEYTNASVMPDPRLDRVLHLNLFVATLVEGRSKVPSICSAICRIEIFSRHSGYPRTNSVTEARGKHKVSYSNQPSILFEGLARTYQRIAPMEGQVSMQAPTRHSFCIKAELVHMIRGNRGAPIPKVVGRCQGRKPSAATQHMCQS